MFGEATTARGLRFARVDLILVVVPRTLTPRVLEHVSRAAKRAWQHRGRPERVEHAAAEAHDVRSRAGREVVGVLWPKYENKFGTEAPPLIDREAESGRARAQWAQERSGLGVGKHNEIREAEEP